MVGSAEISDEKVPALTALYRLVRRDIGRKLIALVLAVTAWMLVGSALRDEQALKFTIEPMYSEPPTVEDRKNKIHIVASSDQILEPVEMVNAEVKLIGTQAALESDWHVSETYIIPHNFLGDDPFRTLTIDNAFVEKRMAPSALPTQDVRLAMDNPVVFTVYKAETATIILNPVDNLVIEGPGAAWISEISEQIEIEPARVEIRGPIEQIDRIRKKPSLLKLTPLVIKEREPTDLEMTLEIDNDQEALNLVEFREHNWVTVKVKEALVEPESKVLMGLQIQPVGTDWVVGQYGSLERLHPPRDSEAWLCDVVVSALPSVWETINVESLRNRIFLYVQLPHLGEAASQAFLRVFWSVHEDADGLGWPKEVKVERLNTDQIHLWIDPSEDSELIEDGG